MFSLICPYCNKGIGVLIDKHKEELQRDKSTELVCNECNKVFIAKSIKDRIKAFKEDGKK